MYYIEVWIPQEEGVIFGGCLGNSKALAIFAAAVAAALLPRSLQKGSFSMPGKRKYYFENFCAQAMRPIGREGGGGIAQRRQSLISTIALFYIRFEKLLKT